MLKQERLRIQPKRNVEMGNNMGGIVVGVDQSETAHRAAVKAAKLAAATGEALHLVMAVKGGKTQSLQVGADQFFESWVTSANQFLNAMRDELGIENTTTAIGGKDPAKSLCDEAERIDATMIVVGNRRVQGATRVLGSVAADVTRHAHCDVLVAHTSDEATTNDAPIRHSITSATVFEGCSAKQLEQIDALGTSISVTEGQELTQQGRTGREFGVLLDGTATVSIDGQTVATLNAGDHFGAMALFATVGAEQPTRSATITADADLWISVMSLGEFSSLMTRFPDVADRLRDVAARRSESNKTIGLTPT
jgi:nucleotide-binding universal stress UspA family protein